jgi:hypothetical protein
MKKFTQPGTFSIILIFPIMIFCIVMMIITGMDEPAVMIIFSFFILIFILCLLTFFKLTIIIDDTHLTFKMGIGMVSKSFPLSDIESCKPVRNPLIYGIGIHMTSSGWLYNVSGSYAVELTFKNRKSRVRIGTGKPEEIAKAVNERIDNRATSSFYEKTNYGGIYLTFIILALIIIFPILLVGYGSREPEATFSDSSMTISGMYGISIDFADILQADTVQSLPHVKSRTNGFAAGKVLKGSFKMQDRSRVMLFAKKGVPPYICIRTADKTVFLNFENSRKTREVFSLVKEKIVVSTLN